MISQRRRRRRAPAHENVSAGGSGGGGRRVVVTRGVDASSGFGFTIAGQRPCVVSCVAAGGGAERAGLRAGDALLAVDGTPVARTEHELIARMIAAAPSHIALTVAAPDDRSDTSEEERGRQLPRVRHAGRPHPRAARRRLHHPAGTAAATTPALDSRPSVVEAPPCDKLTYSVRKASSKDILQLIDGAQAMSLYREEGALGRLECRVVVGYLGTIESPHALDVGAEPGTARRAVRRLRHERRAPQAAPVLLAVTPTALELRRAPAPAPAPASLALYPRERVRGAYAPADGDGRHFALLTRSPPPGAATSCHVFAVADALAAHPAHADTARRFGLACTLDPISGRCLEFPATAAYVVDLVRCMYSLPAAAPELAPAPPPTRSPHPSDRSEPTTGSSNSDSGIGFNNECPDVAERILVVEFERAGHARSDRGHTDSEDHHYETIEPFLRRAPASLDDMLLARDDVFARPAAPRRAGRARRRPAPRAAPPAPAPLSNASSAPDLSLQVGERVSPFRRWTTASGAGGGAAAGGAPGGGAPGSGAGGGRVARWSLGLDQLLADEEGAAAFGAFLAKEFAAENVRFWCACEAYSAAAPAERERLAAAVWACHLADGAPEPVNVDAGARRAADPRRAPRPPPADLFRPAQTQIFDLMRLDSYPRFLRSPLHAECARADLRGLPLPFAPPHTPTSATPPPHSQENTKLKKSASNASERRRSGGSLLPWARLRTASRDRDRPPSPAPASAPPAVGCSLCRLVLPDGATSVVGVEEGVSVRALVDRLLARRALAAPTYDVLVGGEAEGGPLAPVDVDAPSTVLGGRQAAVERRCVFRLELGGRRAVGVRCRPGKRLRHVLRPVLAKYAPAAAAEPLVLLDGRPVPLDSRVQEVDGARLQLGGAEGAPVAAPLPAAAPPCTPTHDDELVTVRAALWPAPAPRPAPAAAPPLPPKPRPPAPS